MSDYFSCAIVQFQSDVCTQEPRTANQREIGWEDVTAGVVNTAYATSETTTTRTKSIFSETDQGEVVEYRGLVQVTDPPSHENNYEGATRYEENRDWAGSASGITQTITLERPSADNTITIQNQGTHSTVAPGGEYHTGTELLITDQSIQKTLVDIIGQLTASTSYTSLPSATVGNNGGGGEYGLTEGEGNGGSTGDTNQAAYSNLQLTWDILVLCNPSPDLISNLFRLEAAVRLINQATRTSSGGIGWIPPEFEWYLTGSTENIRNTVTFGWSDHFGVTNTKKYNYDANGSWTFFYGQSICFTVAREAPLLAFTMSTRAALLGGQGFWRASPYARTLWTTLGPRNLQLLLRAEMGVHALNAGYHAYQVVGNLQDVYNNPRSSAAWWNLGTNSAITLLNAFGLKAAAGTRLNGWRGASVKGSNSLWLNQFPGVQVRRFGDVWVKRVDPNASKFRQWWGRQTINAQHRALQRLGDIATPNQMRNGKLIMQHVGETFTGGRLSLQMFHPTVAGNYIKGSIRMRTPFNDIIPRNMGRNGLIFDPAVDWFSQTITVGSGVGVAAVSYYAYLYFWGDE